MEEEETGRSREEVLLKRGLKKSKLFLIQKMTKNIRTLQNKRGNEQQLEKYKRKIERLNEELETLKELNLTQLTKLLINKNSDTISAVMSSQMIPNELVDRVYWRILKYKVMIKTCKQLNFEWTSNTTDEEEYGNEKESDEEEHEESGIEKSEKMEKEGEEINNEEDYQSDNTTTAAITSLNKHSLTGSMFVGSLSQTKNQHTPKVTIDRTKAKVTNDRTKAKVTIDRTKAKVTNDRTKARVTNNRTKAKVTNDRTKAKFAITTKRSVVSKITMETKRSKPMNSKRSLKKTHKQTTTAFNRMGQRQRRQLWESKYGDEAKHLLQTKRPKGQVKSVKNVTVNEVIHPSWEASKRRKEQENAQKKFEGQHIVFSD